MVPKNTENFIFEEKRLISGEKISIKATQANYRSMVKQSQNCQITVQ